MKNNIMFKLFNLSCCDLLFNQNDQLISILHYNQKSSIVFFLLSIVQNISLNGRDWLASGFMQLARNLMVAGGLWHNMIRFHCLF